MGPPQSSRALILRTRAYGESDRIVTFLAEDHGKLTGIAKGARNSKRRFANCLNPFTLVRVHFRQRRSATLVFMDSCDLLRLPDTLAEPLKFAYGSYLVELVDLLTVEAEPVPKTFHLLADALDALRSGPATPAFLRSFELHLLADAGFAPRLDGCDSCQEELAAGTPCGFDATTGALLCSTCKTRRENLVDVSEAVRAALVRLIDLDPAAARSLRLQEGVRGETADLLGRWLSLHLPRPLKSLGLIESLTR